MKKESIGTATIRYDVYGSVVSAHFEPTMQILPNTELIAQLKGLNNPLDENRTLKQAEVVMATWFSKVTSVELADREKFKIVPHIAMCKKYKNGKPQLCVISFSLEQV